VLFFHEIRCECYVTKATQSHLTIGNKELFRRNLRIKHMDKVYSTNLLGCADVYSGKKLKMLQWNLPRPIIHAEDGLNFSQ
jgi:hypothetical protein